jgi:predicted NBD/HSP70 family sugar kinase
MPTAGKPSKKSLKKVAAKPGSKTTSKKIVAKAKSSVGKKKTLAFDIGGTGLKASILDETGEMLTDRVRIETPRPCPPGVLLEKFKELIAQLPAFDRVSVGFPGVVRHGKTLSCKNLGSDE